MPERAELRASYRLQLSPDFGFAAACSLVPYVRDLGISHLHLSGSGGDDGEFEALSNASRDAGMALLVDVEGGSPLTPAGRGLVDGLEVGNVDALADPVDHIAGLGASRVWVEKLLAPGERLRDWPVCGTAGHDFSAEVSALFVDPAAEAPLNELWRSVSGDARSFEQIVREAKFAAVKERFAGEVAELARLAPGVDTEAVAEGLAALPVYRTYVDPEAGTVSEADRDAIELLPRSLQPLLLLEAGASPEFVTRFQQTSAAVMAVAVEEAMGSYGRLLALNEAGGDAGRFGLSVECFHERSAERAARFPQSLLATDGEATRRSGDVRACIAALSWMPEEWHGAVERFFAAARPARDGDGMHDAELYMLFQTLVGAWPIEPGDGFGEIELFGEPPFRDELESFVAGVRPAGERAALAQLVLKLTAPGIPEIYQGDELWLRTVGGAGRARPVDWSWHQAMLRRLMGGSPPDRPTLKLFLTMRLLGLRARRPEPLVSGSYEPVQAGPDVCGYVRGGEVLVLVAVRGGPLAGSFEGPGGRWRDVLRGEERRFASAEPLDRVLDRHSFAVFERLGG